MATLAEQLQRGDLPAPVTLMEIHHGDLSEPIRLANDTDDFTHKGNSYSRFRFVAVRPGEQPRQQPTAQLSFQRIDALVDLIEQTNGADGATVDLLDVARDEPDAVKAELRNLDIRNIRISAEHIVITLALPNTLDRPAVGIRFDPETAPGLFF